MGAPSPFRYCAPNIPLRVVHGVTRVCAGNERPRPVSNLCPSQGPPPGRYTGHMHPPVRLVAIDMDGTLLPTFAQKLSRRGVRAILAAQAAGITVAVATGRRTAYTAPLLEGLDLRADMP